MEKTIRYEVKYEVKYEAEPDIYFISSGELVADIVFTATVNVKIVKSDNSEVTSFTKTFGHRRTVNDNINLQEVIKTMVDEVTKYIEDIQKKVEKTEKLIKEFYAILGQK